MAMNLASWLDRLAAEAPEELVTVRRPVEPAAFESAAVVDALEHQKRYPAVLFEQVRDLEGRPTDCRILNNTFGTFKKIALALGMDTDQRMPIMERMLELSGRSLEPVITDPAQAPVRHWAQQGDDVDLTRLPLIRHTELDGGPYLTPIVVSRTPQGRYNVSWNRMQYLDPTHLAIYMSPRHLSSYFAEAEAAGRDLPIAVVLGHHPAFHLTGALLTPLDADEYAVAGAVMGQPLELIPSLSFGQELLIPAQAELVLEGRILAGKRCVEGPFGEFTGYAGPQRLSWVVEISAVYGKACPTIIDIFPCYTEHINAHLPIEASIYQRAKQAVPGVVKTCWVGSGGPFNLIISLTKEDRGRAHARRPGRHQRQQLHQARDRGGRRRGPRGPHPGDVGLFQPGAGRPGPEHPQKPPGPGVGPQPAPRDQDLGHGHRRHPALGPPLPPPGRGARTVAPKPEPRRLFGGLRWTSSA